MYNHNYYVYLLTNKHKTVLYTGVTNNLRRRLGEHMAGVNPHCFTCRYHCYYLVYYEHHTYINNAIEREKEIKGWTRVKKNALIALENEKWNFLNEEVLNW